MTDNNQQLEFDKPLFSKPLSLEFFTPQTIQQADALEAFNNLTPQQRTELLADMFVVWHTWHTQYELVGAGG